MNQPLSYGLPLLLLGSCMTPCASANASASDTPNIIVILIDDMGYTDIACDGSLYHRTPNIDSLARAGMHFTSAYSACTVSSPTRAAMMTGKYPARLHLTDWIPGQNFKYAPMSPPDWTKYLPLEETTVAEVLREAGYTTWHVGKWHLDGKSGFGPDKQGFDRVIGVGGKDDPGDRGEKVECGKYFPPYCLRNLPDGPENEYLTDRLTAEAVSLIEQKPSKPFFLYLAHYAVHTPLMAKQDKIEMYTERLRTDYFQQNPTYAAMVESVDESVGAIMAALRRSEQLDNTLVIFVSDNGALCRVIRNNPFREGKGSAYEGGVRVPMIAFWQGHIAPGTTCDQPVITMDIPATCMDIVHSEQLSKIDGVSLLPLFEGEKLEERPLFWHYPHNHNGGSRTYSAVRLGPWKLIEQLSDNSLELYNLKEDIGESQNLASTEKKRTEQMYKMLKRWRTEVGAQMPVPNPKADPSKDKSKWEVADEK